MRTVASFLLLLAFSLPSIAAPKIHQITFGKATTVKWLVGSDEKTELELKVRPMYVDARLREYTLGSPHEITDRLFAVRRAFRVNDALAEEPPSPRLWRWQRGGWLLVDRFTGRISPINLPEFDPYASAASWYRDYVAYCGLSDDGKKISAVVLQVGRRRPLLKKVVAPAPESEMPDSSCATPVWQRQPARVTFDVGKDQKFTFGVQGHAFDVVENDDDADPAE
jgi:hypothetical protein